MIIASDLIAGYTVVNSSFPRFSRHEILLYLFREGSSRGGKREKVFSSSLSPLISEVGLLPLINFLGERKIPPVSSKQRMHFSCIDKGKFILESVGGGVNAVF